MSTEGSPTVLAVRTADGVGVEFADEPFSIVTADATDGSATRTDVDCAVVFGDGEEALAAVETLRETDPALPIVLASTRPDGRLAAAATRRGATEYFHRNDGTDDLTLADRVDALSTGRDFDRRGLDRRGRERDGERADASLENAVELTGAFAASDGERTATDADDRDETTTALLSTTRSLFSAETPSAVSRIVADAAVDVFDFDLAVVRLYDADTDTLEPTGFSTGGIDSIEAPPPVSVGEGPIGEAFERGATVLFDDLGERIGHDHSPLQRGMVLPLGEYGVLGGGSIDPTAFDESDVRFVELLATSARAALERAGRRDDLLRHERVLETVEGLVYALDAEGRFTLVTEPFAESVGYERDRLLGEHASLILDEEDVERGKRRIQRLLTDPDADSVSFEAAYTAADGRQFPVEVEMSVLPFDDEFRGTVGVVRDITERRAREQYLEVLTRVLRHNLRNDLTVVSGYAEMLADELETSELADVAAHLHEAVNGLARTSQKANTIEHALDRETADRYPVDVAALVEGGAVETRNAAPGAEITVSAPQNCWALADEGLNTAVANLLENAILHAGATPTIRIAARERDGTVSISIADDGPGIPRAEIDVVTGREEITQLTHSSGLGLWLVRWLVDAVDGTVTFDESSLGGSEVTIELEATDPPADDGR